MDIRVKREIKRAKPTKEEAIILFNAQKDYVERGNTPIKCPRCGKSLEYRCGESGEATYCTDENCIIVYTRGI